MFRRFFRFFATLCLSAGALAARCRAPTRQQDSAWARRHRQSPKHVWWNFEKIPARGPKPAASVGLRGAPATPNTRRRPTRLSYLMRTSRDKPRCSLSEPRPALPGPGSSARGPDRRWPASTNDSTNTAVPTPTPGAGDKRMLSTRTSVYASPMPTVHRHRAGNTTRKLTRRNARRPCSPPPSGARSPWS